MKPAFIALDFVDAQHALKFLEPFKDIHPLAVKIGMELFYRDGSSIIKKLRQQGIDVFLDLKLHDIPNTVEKTAYQLGKLDVQYITVHSLGGSEMIKSAKRGLQAGSQKIGVKPPQLLAVTQLTSISQKQLNDEQLINASIDNYVVHLAKIAKDSGADGVISSAWENNLIHQEISSDFKCINPGIRFAMDNKNDQKRVVDPKQAFKLNTNGVVLGRIVTLSKNPVDTYKNIYQIINGGTQNEY